MKYRVLVVVEKAPRNYSAYAPEVPGCVTTGKTIEETLRNMREALLAHLGWMAEDGDEMPLNASREEEAHYVEVEVNVPAASRAS